MSEGGSGTAVLSPLAEDDLEGIGDFIAENNPERALSFVRELRQACDKIARNPMAYRQRPELGAHIRSSVYGRYLIFFTVAGSEVTVARILHAARNLPSAFKPRP